MSKGTGFVNFGDILAANRQYPQHVQEQREAAGQAIRDYDTQFGGIESQYGQQVGRAAGAIGDLAGSEIWNVEDYFGTPETLRDYRRGYIDIANRANEIYDQSRADYGVSSGSAGIGGYYDRYDDVGLNESLGRIEDTIKDVSAEVQGRSFDTGVDRVGSVGEKTLDSAIFGDLYGTDDPAFSDYQSGLDEKLAAQFLGGREMYEELQGMGEVFNEADRDQTIFRHLNANYFGV